jgi:cold shock CspA family protein
MSSTGTIGRLVRNRGFGFIRDERGEETFFHHTAVEGGPAAFDALQEGEPVAFDREPDPRGRGYRATRMQVTTPER